MPKVIHISFSIEGLLKDYKGKSLAGVLSDDGRPLSDAEARKTLQECLDKGWTKLPSSEACEGFDPKTGCPGHEIIPNTLCLGAKFTSKWFRGECSVQEINEEANMLQVGISYYNAGRNHSRTEEWNLGHTKQGFQNGDYTFEPIKQPAE